MKQQRALTSVLVLLGLLTVTCDALSGAGEDHTATSQAAWCVQPIAWELGVFPQAFDVVDKACYAVLDAYAESEPTVHNPEFEIPWLVENVWSVGIGACSIVTHGGDPDSSRGVAIEVYETSRMGKLQAGWRKDPLEYFEGFAYGRGHRPVTDAPGQAFGGLRNCATPAEAWAADNFGVMGLLCDGVAVCAGGTGLDESSAEGFRGIAGDVACCRGSECIVLGTEECEDLGGRPIARSLECFPGACQESPEENGSTVGFRPSSIHPLASLWTFQIHGLSPDQIDSVELRVGQDVFEASLGFVTGAGASLWNVALPDLDSALTPTLLVTATRHGTRELVLESAIAWITSPEKRLIRKVLPGNLDIKVEPGVLGFDLGQPVRSLESLTRMDPVSALGLWSAGVTEIRKVYQDASDSDSTRVNSRGDVVPLKTDINRRYRFKIPDSVSPYALALIVQAVPGVVEAAAGESIGILQGCFDAPPPCYVLAAQLSGTGNCLVPVVTYPATQWPRPGDELTGTIIYRYEFGRDHPDYSWGEEDSLRVWRQRYGEGVAPSFETRPFSIRLLRHFGTDWRRYRPGNSCRDPAMLSVVSPHRYGEPWFLITDGILGSIALCIDSMGTVVGTLERQADSDGGHAV